jgi:hypothetical protein
MQWHMTVMAFTYLFSRPVVWGSTAKEARKVDCFTALSETLQVFRVQYIMCVILVAGYSVAIHYFSLGFVQAWCLIAWCGGHLLAPIMLNPTIMSLSH